MGNHAGLHFLYNDFLTSERRVYIDDKYSISKSSLESNISTLFGGRIAEEMTLGADHVTTGASNDIERATDIARNMVTKWGLSEKLGPLTYSEDDGEVFLGRSVTQHKQVSDDTARRIDAEIRQIIDTAHQKALDLVNDNRVKLDIMAEALIKYETIDTKQIDDIMEGRDPGPPAHWKDGKKKADGGDGGDGEAAKSESSSDRDDPSPIGGPAGQT